MSVSKIIKANISKINKNTNSNNLIDKTANSSGILRGDTEKKNNK